MDTRLKITTEHNCGKVVVSEDRLGNCGNSWREVLHACWWLRISYTGCNMWITWCSVPVFDNGCKHHELSLRVYYFRLFVSRLLVTWSENTQNYESPCCFEWIQIGVPHYGKSVGYTDVRKRVIRNVSGTKREDVTWGWIKLHSDELREFCTSPNNISSTKSRSIW
jgi:hypothetical protein